MNIVQAWPPNIDAIRFRFKLNGSEIFAYGDTIYNPTGVPLPPSLLAHEEVHQRQQGDDPAGWWERYLIDAKWRFAQELEAHQVEYSVLCTNADRKRRRFYLAQLARRLSSPMYGNVATLEKCKRLIKGM